mgnify:CR=1 FL=1
MLLFTCVNTLRACLLFVFISKPHVDQTRQSSHSSLVWHSTESCFHFSSQPTLSFFSISYLPFSISYLFVSLYKRDDRKYLSQISSNAFGRLLLSLLTNVTYVLGDAHSHLDLLHWLQSDQFIESVIHQ